MIYIGLDDTDVLESRGTGHLAREIAQVLAQDGLLLGVTRHQLLLHPEVRYTKNNSSAALLFDDDVGDDLDALLERVRDLVMQDYYPGSDPGICVALDPPPAITAFGRRVQQKVVSQGEARALAEAHSIPLLGLGGDESGVIGALAAVGLAASGDDGRYVLVGRSRELQGELTVTQILDAGIGAVQTLDGQPVHDGLITVDRLRPARRNGRPVLVVEREGDRWLPLKLD
jgi:tRNA(Ile2) C34 agmatinyltransferase TiaS